MTSTRLWDRAADLPMVVGRRPRPEIAALPADGLPSLAELFTFMRDAELRFDTLRMRIEERTLRRRRRAARDRRGRPPPPERRPGHDEPSPALGTDGELRGLDLRRRDRPDVQRRPPARHRAAGPARRRRRVGPESRDLPGHEPGLRPADRAADGDAARDLRPSCRLLPERARRPGDCRIVGPRRGRRPRGDRRRVRPPADDRDGGRPAGLPDPDRGRPRPMA